MSKHLGTGIFSVICRWDGPKPGSQAITLSFKRSKALVISQIVYLVFCEYFAKKKKSLKSVTDAFGKMPTKLDFFGRSTGL